VWRFFVCILVAGLLRCKHSRQVPKAALQQSNRRHGHQSYGWHAAISTPPAARASLKRNCGCWSCKTSSCPSALLFGAGFARL
jgi:hypothetical protein